MKLTTPYRFLAFIAMHLIVLGLSSQDQKYASNPDRTIRELKLKLNKDKHNYEELKELSSLLVNRGDYNQTIFYARKLDSISTINKNEVYQMYAGIYLGQALMMNGVQEESRYYMDKSLKLAISLSNDSALASAYNGLGLYAANIEMDYYRSINYFFEGIQAAQKSSNERLYSILLCNISGIYYLKKDPKGLKYALECYELGHKKRDPYLIFCGSTNSAYMYYLQKDYEEALKYIKEAEFIMDKNNFYDRANVYNLYGNILLEKGDKSSAHEMFDKALSFEEHSQISSIVDSYLGLAKLMIVDRKYPDALAFLYKGLDISQKNKNTIHTLTLYEKIADTYQLEENYESAIMYYKIYHHLSDSVFNADKERSISELRVKYDMEKHENEVQQSNLIILQKEKNIQALLFALVLIILLLGGTYLSYYRKNKLYLQIVKRNQEAIKKEKYLQAQLAELSETEPNNPAPDKYTGSSLTDEKSLSLYNKLDNLMRKEHIYRQKDITKEKLALSLNTNRTYLSQVINTYANVTFNHFINSFRIEDAVRTLSDPESDVPLKALASDLGFNSITTFYKAFQSSVGMTPSQYREKVVLLEKMKSK